ncbi:hypothetical protein ACFL08_00740 [Patescibacteria group bacterium]
MENAKERFVKQVTEDLEGASLTLIGEEEVIGLIKMFEFPENVSETAADSFAKEFVEYLLRLQGRYLSGDLEEVKAPSWMISATEELLNIMMDRGKNRKDMIAIVEKNETTESSSELKRLLVKDKECDDNLQLLLVKVMAGM